MEASGPFAPDFGGDKVKSPETRLQFKRSSRGCQPREMDGLCGSLSCKWTWGRISVELELLGPRWRGALSFVPVQAGEQSKCLRSAAWWDWVRKHPAAAGRGWPHPCSAQGIAAAKFPFVTAFLSAQPHPIGQAFSSHHVVLLPCVWLTWVANNRPSSPPCALSCRTRVRDFLRQDTNFSI